MTHVSSVLLFSSSYLASAFAGPVSDFFVVRRPAFSDGDRIPVQFTREGKSALPPLARCDVPADPGTSRRCPVAPIMREAPGSMGLL